MNKNSLIQFALLILTATFISSCSSDSGESNGTTTGNYWPMKVNNVWNLNSNGVAQQLKINGSDVFGGTTYYKLYDEGDDSSLNIQNWVTKKGATYFQKIGDVTTVQNGITIKLEGYQAPIFKDDLEVNETWSGSVSPKLTYTFNGESGSLPTKIDYIGRIVQRDATETINSVTYNSIIKMTMSIETNVDGQINVVESEYWFAKDIGIVREYEIVDDGIPTERLLIDYVLN